MWTTISLSRKEKIKHLFGWMCYLTLMHLLFSFSGSLDRLLLVRPVGYAFVIIMFYALSLVVLPTFSRNRNYLVLIVSVAVIYVIHMLYAYVTRYYFIVWYDSSIFDGSMPMLTFIRTFSFWFLYYVLGAVVFYSYKSAIYDLKRKNELEKELIKTQLMFLNAQFNPHFLFNVLNYIYDKAVLTSDELARAVLLLSQIMRYSLREDTPHRRVPIGEEVKYVRNFIELNKLRFDNKIFVDFRINENYPDRKVVPFVIISLVENAFKYGELNDPASPLSITVQTEADVTTVTVENKKKQRSAPVVSTGIGLQNVLQRLRLVYGEDFKLDISDQTDTYRCELTITEQPVTKRRPQGTVAAEVEGKL